jgi:hypothetical protein
MEKTQHKVKDKLQGNIKAEKNKETKMIWNDNYKHRTLGLRNKNIITVIIQLNL